MSSLCEYIWKVSELLCVIKSDIPKLNGIYL